MGLQRSFLSLLLDKSGKLRQFEEQPSQFVEFHAKKRSCQKPFDLVAFKIKDCMFENISRSVFNWMPI